ncbi:MAG: MarR family transcriptional regulator [Eubacteriales bacterium]|nr:MarR family transcriptional regulator [Eubacteriales bacterium]
MPAISRSLTVIMRCADNFRGKLLAPLGLTASQAPYVLYCCRHPGASQEQIAAALYTSRSSATRQLVSLEEIGFITRAASQKDRRLTLVTATDKAQAAFPRIREINRGWQEAITRGMSGADKAALQRLLDMMQAEARRLLEGEGA